MVKRFRYDNKNPASSISSDEIHSIFIDHNGNLWIATEGRGLNCINVQTGKILRTIKSETKNNIAYSFCEDKNGVLWVGTAFSGLLAINLNNGDTGTFPTDSAKAPAFFKYEIRSIYLDKKGKLWIGSRGGGLACMDPKTLKMEIYTHDDKNPWSLSGDMVLSIIEDKKGRIWAGTEGSGLNCMDPVSKKFIRFTEREGLPNSVILGLLEDRAGNLWMSTNKGISRLKPPENIFSGSQPLSLLLEKGSGIRNYDIKDGLPANEFNVGACYQSPDGHMYFGSNNHGLVCFFPDSFRDNTFVPPVKITDFQLFNRSILPGDSVVSMSRDISETDTINLSFKNNTFSFSFSALNFINPEKNHFQFKLDGIDKEWNKTDARRRFATYTNLEPGIYTFHVMASNNDGKWNEKGDTITIIIDPPWYKTLGFKIIATTLLLAMVYFIYWSRLNKIKTDEKNKTEMNRKISEIRLVALRAQMNPHFIFNSLNSINQFIYNNDRDEAAKYLSKFSKLIRQILENSTQNTIILSDEIKILQLYMELEALRFQGKFDFKVELDEDLDPDNVEIPSMLIQPYIENAILHGFASKVGIGTIWLKMHEEGDVLKCIIEDNGIGREKAKELKQKKLFHYKSMGMSVTQDRLDILNQYLNRNISVEIIDLKDEKGEPSGTRVEISVPMEEH